MIKKPGASIYFHLGLPKTASTYLQRVVFPQLKGLTFHKKHDFKDYHMLSSEEDEIHLFSCEMDLGIEKEMESISAKFPGAGIILVFRSHYSWILSKYKYSIRKWNHLDVGDYYSTDDDGLLVVPENYYRSIIDKAELLFPGRVLVLNYHDLKGKPGDIERDIQRFIGITPTLIEGRKTVNKAFTNRQLVHLLKYNKSHRYYESKSNSKFMRKLHYRYRQYLLHIVAFFSKFIPANEAGFLRELEEEKKVVDALYEEDWAFVISRSGYESASS